jgi:hypothetical protein
MSGVTTPEVHPNNVDKGYSYKDCVDCEDLDGTYRLSAVGGPNYVLDSTSLLTHKYTAGIPNGRVCCPCGSGLCAKNLLLTVEPYLATDGYDSKIFREVVGTKIKLEVNSNFTSGGFPGAVATYEKKLGNHFFVGVSGEPIEPSGRLSGGPRNWNGYGGEWDGTYGLIEPLSIGNFQNVILDLKEYDEGYVNSPEVAESGNNTFCNLPDTVEVSLFEAESYVPIPAQTIHPPIVVPGLGEFYNQDNINFANLDQIARYAYVTIDNNWTRTIETGPKTWYDSDLGKDVTCNRTTFNISCGIWFSTNWTTGAPTPTCEQAYNCMLSRVGKEKCALPMLQYVTESCRYDCDDPTYEDGCYHRTPPYDDDDPFGNWHKCYDYWGDDICEFSWPSEELPGGTYACELQAITDHTNANYAFPHGGNPYYKPVREFTDCGGAGRISNIPIGSTLWSYYPAQWIYYNDPCNLFSKEVGPITYESPWCYGTYWPPWEGIWCCGIRGEPVDYNPGTTWYPKGVDCSMKMFRIITYCAYNVESVKFYVVLEPVCSYIYGGAPRFESEEIPLPPMDACNGIETAIGNMVRRGDISGINCYPMNDSHFSWGPWFWPGDQPISLTLG